MHKKLVCTAAVILLNIYFIYQHLSFTRLLQSLAVKFFTVTYENYYIIDCDIGIVRMPNIGDSETAMIV